MHAHSLVYACAKSYLLYVYIMHQSAGIKIKYDCNEGTCKTCEAMLDGRRVKICVVRRHTHQLHAPHLLY